MQRCRNAKKDSSLELSLRKLMHPRTSICTPMKSSHAVPNSFIPSASRRRKKTRTLPMKNVSVVDWSDADILDRVLVQIEKFLYVKGERTMQKSVKGPLVTVMFVCACFSGKRMNLARAQRTNEGELAFF